MTVTLETAQVVRTTLSPEEMMVASYVGARREINARVRGFKDKFNWDRGAGWGQHIEGAGAELAVAKYLGIYWSGVPLATWRNPDVSGAQVRLRMKDRTDLAIRADDNPTDRYISVLGAMPTYTIQGWLLGSDGQVEEFLHPVEYEGNPRIYYVPPHRLRSMDEWG